MGTLRPLTGHQAADQIASRGGWLFPPATDSALVLFAFELSRPIGSRWEPIAAMMVGKVYRSGPAEVVGLWASEGEAVTVLVQAARVGVVAHGRTVLHWRGVPPLYRALIEDREHVPQGREDIRVPTAEVPSPVQLPGGAILLLQQYRYLNEKEAAALGRALGQPHPERERDRAAAEQLVPPDVLTVARDRLNRDREGHQRRMRRGAAVLADRADDVLLTVLAGPLLDGDAAGRLAGAWWSAAPYPFSPRAARAEALAERWRPFGVARLPELANEYWGEDGTRLGRSAQGAVLAVRRSNPELYVYWRRSQPRFRNKGMLWPLVLAAIAEGLIDSEDYEVLCGPWLRLMKIDQLPEA